ncbi:MAG: hypothetical protein Q9208_008609 [Pyrenodesmia sp. 3 TL-2023]
MVPYDNEKTMARNEKTVTRNTMIPYDKERTMTRNEKTVTRDTMVPYDKERTRTGHEKTVTHSNRTMVPHDKEKNVTRDTRIQTIRDDERAATRPKLSTSSRNSSAPSRSAELERRVERLEDEKTRRLERQVEKLGDQVAQLQMEKGKQRQMNVFAAPVVYAPAATMYYDLSLDTEPDAVNTAALRTPTRDINCSYAVV